MSKALSAVLFLLLPLWLYAQVSVTGTVVDSDRDKPLAGASVVIKGADGKIKKFSTSKSDGTFAISIPSVEGCRLEVAMMSYRKKSVPLDSVSFPLTVALSSGGIKLKEVAVKADRIREQGDTITYRVGAFAQTQDRSIGDVLKRMPGIDVSKQGRIKYQGEDINKFYIEGSDMLGGKYGVATNGINHEDVSAVEVMENHQPMQVLSGISFSDKAAINLRLKEKAKATWSYHGDAGGGFSSQPEGALWDAEAFVMAILPSFQHITTIRTNNTGENLAATDFFASGRSTGLGRYVGVSLPSVPSLNRRRTLLNRSLIVSTNNLKKLRSGEFKANIDYSYNRTQSSADNITTYFLDEGNRIVTENRSGRQYTNSLSGKFIYELNAKTAFINNTLKTNIDWDRAAVRTTGSIPNGQSARLPDYYVANQFRMIRRFEGKHLVTFESHNEWESLPQTLNLSLGDQSLIQHIGDHAFYTDESASYAFTLKGVTVGLDGGVKAYFRSMNSRLPELPEELPGLTHNVVSTNYTTLYLRPRFEYWVKRVNLNLALPVSFARYTFDNSIADRNETYFSPSLSVNWKPNNRFSGTLRGSLGRSPMSLRLLHPGLIMTDYRTFYAGVDNFYNSTSQNVSANLSYKNPRRGIFASCIVSNSWSHVPYTMSQQLFGDYAVYSYSDADNDGKSFSAMANVGKTLDFMRGSIKLTGSFNRGQSSLISQQKDVRSVSNSWSMGCRLNGSIMWWLNFDCGTNFSENRLKMNGDSRSWLSSMTNELSFTAVPVRRWEWTLRGEHYRNELTENNYKDMILLDTRISFLPTKRIEISASLTNILNKKTYSYTTYSQLSSFESLRYIRGRELLLTLTLRK